MENCYCCNKLEKLLFFRFKNPDGRQFIKVCYSCQKLIRSRIESGIFTEDSVHDVIARAIAKKAVSRPALTTDEIAVDAGFCSYNHYLDSAKWKNALVRLRKKNCFCCNGLTAVRLRHLNLSSIGREREMDVCSTCDTCHEVIMKKIRDGEYDSSDALYRMKRDYARAGNHSANKMSKNAKIWQTKEAVAAKKARIAQLRASRS